MRLVKRFESVPTHTYINMQNDFEVHPRGTGEELRLSRELSSEIQKSLDWLGERLPINVRQAHNRLYAHYIKQIELEKYP